MRSRDLRRIVDLCREVGEIAAPDEALQHLLTGSARIIGAEVVSLFAAHVEHDCYRAGGGTVMGLDPSQMALAQRWYFEPGAPIRDPLNRALCVKGEARDVRTRRSLIGDRVWYEDPHTQEKARGLGLDDVLVLVRPLGDANVMFLLHRAPGDRPFDDGDPERLSLLADLSGWFFERLAGAGILVPAYHQPPLPPRLSRVLDELLSGLSEKEIAARLQCRPATVHKYVEQLYRTYAVSSRAELMALWIPPPERRYTPVRIEYR